MEIEIQSIDISVVCEVCGRSLEVDYIHANLKVRVVPCDD